MTFFYKHITKLLSVIFILVFALSAFSCKNKSENNIVIDFWGMGSEGEILKQLVPEFERRNPGIKVNVQMIPWTAAQEKLISAFAADNLPDLFQLGNTWVPQFAELGAIINLNSFISKSDVIKKEYYFPGIWDTNIIFNKVFGIPWYIDTRILFYRKDVLEKAGFNQPPKTWDELYTLSKRIRNNANGEDKYAIYLPTNEWSPFIIFGLQNGSTILKDSNAYADFSGAKFKEAFKYLIKFHKENLAPIGISQVTSVYQSFAQEYFSMYISGPWNIVEFKKWMKGDLADKWGTAPLPGRYTYPGVSTAGGSSLVMSRNSIHKEAAWKFIEYLSETKTQLQFYNLVNDLPAVKSVWEEKTFKDDPYIKAFYEQFLHVVPTPKIPEWEQIVFAKVQQYAEEAARGSITEDEALKRLDADVNTILEKRRWVIKNKPVNN
ncbi:MAG: sugar ABC transporter substrate-binding protein [Bacteroidota bacterium]|nr:sugar ABC transporter substrate-binding protein [Bacteroidota bacterium]